MKRILKTSAICLVALLAFNCSSDDNNNGGNQKDTLYVLDKVEVTVYSTFSSGGILEKTELFSENTYVFNYDAQGRVVTIDIDGLDEIPYDGGVRYKKTATISYTASDKISSLITVDQENNEVWADINFEYDATGMLVRSIDKEEEGDVTNYTHNDKKQIASIDVTGNGYQEVVNFEYDANGNMSSAVNPAHAKSQVLFTYDTYKNPYTNMTLDATTYDDYESAYLLNLFKIAKNNILTYQDELKMKWEMEHTYNAEGYPVTSTLHYQKDKTMLGGSYKYTYKTITVEK